MTFGKKETRILLICAAALAFTAGPGPLPAPAPAYAASEVAVIVNKTAVTSGDIAKRAAFLRLQRRKGDLKKIAREELVEEILKREEIARVGMSVSTDEVDAAFERFAASNKLTSKQLTGILSQAGVGADHFKAYIAVSMSWPRLVNARYGTRGKLSNQDLVTRLLESKEKPVTTEYFLKQVIFVIPDLKAQFDHRKAEVGSGGLARQVPRLRSGHGFRQGLSRRFDPQSWTCPGARTPTGMEASRRKDKGHNDRNACDRAWRGISGDLQPTAGFGRRSGGNRLSGGRSRQGQACRKPELSEVS